MQGSTKHSLSIDTGTEAEPGSVVQDALSGAEEEARQRRKLRNRESAARSREKRRQRNSELERSIAKLRTKAELVESLRSELTVLVTRMQGLHETG